MKLKKVLLLVSLIVVILLAFTQVAFGIGFKAEEKYNSVFVVTSGNALGSGFAVGENCIVTNAHVLGNLNSINLKNYSGESYTAYLVGYDKEKDIAVLGVKGAKFTPLIIADPKALNTGDDVYAIGAPKSMAYTLTKGVISAKERKIGLYTYIQTDAAINEGNSGGPLINDEGNVLGMNTLKMSNSEGIGLAIPMAEVSAFIKTLNIKTDANGNVLGAIAQDDNSSEQSSGTKTPTESEKDSNQKTPQEGDDKTKSPKTTKANTLLVIGLCCSGILNIVLIVLLMFQKKKNFNLKYDPRERIDFEIDILE